MSETSVCDPKLEALKIILDARRHEIDLEWKRGLFFWGFVALAAAGTGHALTGNENLYVAMLTSGLGTVAAFASYLAAKGSKRWQETWELRAEIAEIEVIGKVFGSSAKGDHSSDGVSLESTHKHDTGIENLTECHLSYFFLDSTRHSVSKLYIALNLFATVSFIALFIIICFKLPELNIQSSIDIVKLISIIISVLTLLIFLSFLFFCCRSGVRAVKPMKLK